MGDRLVVEGGKATLTTAEGQCHEFAEGLIAEMVEENARPPLGGLALPDGVKLTRWKRPFFLAVHQYAPQVRLLSWIAADSPVPYGPGLKVKQVRLSLPYTIVFATYQERRGRLSLVGQNELYFSTAPLRSVESPLCFPALLNVSRIEALGRERAWICTQYLTPKPGADWTEQLDSLLAHLWNGDLNYSSERHEGASWYTTVKGIHRDLHPVGRWEEATSKDELFALKVPWRPVPCSTGQLMDRMIDEAQSQALPFIDLPRPRREPAPLLTRLLNFTVKRRAAEGKGPQ